ARISWPPTGVDEQALAQLSLRRVVVVSDDQEAAFQPYPDDGLALLRGSLRGVVLDRAPCCPVDVLPPDRRVAHAVRLAGINVVQDAVEDFGIESSPDFQRRPRFDRLHLVAGRV